MKIAATLKNSFRQNEMTVETDGETKSIPITPKSTGYGSSVNGAELLLLSLATCFCNDIYREAKKRNMIVSDVEVVFTGEFGKEGEPGSDFQYKAIVKSDSPAEEINELIKFTDSIAEIHNTLRKGTNITLIANA